MRMICELFCANATYTKKDVHKHR